MLSTLSAAGATVLGSVPWAQVATLLVSLATGSASILL